ncbi:uncharacterized protein CDV56_108589 [Aspergillus thermomutatus]|uniref:Uncharacterized protein n=1 Tax=Aspergillus thermomutatus TaxID=41047 RepID=A0A397HXM2_ASPTH|nr:uncharacterized protein CDV56_108589 [Aspergillus thermomutatus]RHZ65340.1 hypothetical protein CDV56_108589 [Aspergillus thermomutatus]
MPPSNQNSNNSPKPWGSHYAPGVTIDSTGGRTFVEGGAFIDDDEEGPAWQHVEDISTLTPEEKEFANGCRAMLVRVALRRVSLALVRRVRVLLGRNEHRRDLRDDHGGGTVMVAFVGCWNVAGCLKKEWKM